MASKSSTRLLDRYRAKRDFQKTAEPTGSSVVRPGQNSYLIQKHAARRLHYDFRLEMDGVLKSWAVTKGPSLNPADKRLAVHVEDHPLDYGGFEGTIPEGQYGGGTVMLWDNGTWEPIGDPARGYKKGKLDFQLHGTRLKGRWHLVRLRGNRRGNDKHENWLLIKGKDEHADEENGDVAIERYQKSVVSKRSMEDIATGAGKVWKGGKSVSKPALNPAKKKTPKPAKKTPGKKASEFSPPDFVPPQLATLVTAPPVGPNWVHEIKFDGYRLLARLEKGEVTLTTRNNNDWTAKFKELAGDVGKLPAHNAILDGEVVSMEPDGSMSFHALQNALRSGKRDALHYFAFDLLFLDGEDLRSKPLLERKATLKKLLVRAPSHIHYSEHFAEEGAKVLSYACHTALEGIISKRSDATYHSGRGEYWLKAKCIKEQELVIGGFTTQPKKPGNLGALLLGYYERDLLVFAGKVGTGYSHGEGQMILKKLQQREQKTSPFKSIPIASRKGALFVKPELVAHVNFAEWTADGVMRHPSFQGLREDKAAKDVVREKPKAPPVATGKQAGTRTARKKTGGSNGAKAEVAGIAISHPDKVVYRQSGITKLDLAHYYEKIAPRLLPHIAGRPISLLRCPEGEGKACLFQRHGGQGLSPYIKELKVAGHGAGKNGKEQPYLVVDDVKGLVSLIQMGVLEIHVWGAMPNAPDYPNRIVFDLDPAPDVSFTEVKRAALEIRANLKKLKLESFLKTTGGKGLHVVVPFREGTVLGRSQGILSCLFGGDGQGRARALYD